MKIFLTGSDGFTGRHFTASAIARGHEVIALTGQLDDKAGLEHQLAQAQADAVVHLAAIAFVGHADAGAFYDVNVLGTMNLLDALARVPKRPAAVLLASSANIYGNCDVSPIGESQPPAPANHYAMSKLAMEYMARNYLDRLPIVFARPFNYTGAGQHASFVIPKLVDHFARRASVVELGNLDVEREFNDVRTVCDAYLALLDKGAPGQCYNVCSGQPVTLRAVIALLQEITGHSLEVRVNPAFVRASEVRTLCGSPALLEQAIGPLHHPGLRATLQWMLDTSPVAH
ncbi:GDP-mannose 4,6-dehydratase [Herbaspirillum huttiense F1]|uniref:NAD-dependent epimerase/dehydratase family protein n=1 Tax=unclassified Herbaspirillum TaxID=2624150 RepID=UPI000C0AB6B0|nr:MULTISPECIES: NAD-dependent epimerase/dehydratase family protein [Herbaspirillum]MAF02834.1 GDP-mannose 4,6 dehydratase [Herbaspirillum sp.]MBN9355074.1 NAD-dependent epimerase/dehydratase family protein [Herbaspirillum huttiense]MBO15677.1 GDP-mannose 4,6 dehydratase [Herbaspirillum sp.]MCO4858809.1 GDP-mannose 4,6-dehydratase [Herbaspirillum sp. WGmk3]MDT0358326.1 GDP-mannose 4,6-dehydratase [Herbaspirillum huttiense F1]